MSIAVLIVGPTFTRTTTALLQIRRHPLSSSSSSVPIIRIVPPSMFHHGCGLNDTPPQVLSHALESPSPVIVVSGSIRRVGLLLQTQSVQITRVGFSLNPIIIGNVLSSLKIQAFVHANGHEIFGPHVQIQTAGGRSSLTFVNARPQQECRQPLTTIFGTTTQCHNVKE